MTNAIKNTETRATQLTALMEFAKLNGFEGNTDKLEKVLAQWTAPRERKATGPSKVALENAAKAKEVYAAMPEGEAVTNLWIMEHVNGIMTTNKSSKIMEILIDQKLVSKQKIGKVMTYTKL